MMKYEELRNQNSCLNRAAADEPLFVLRANDPVAAQTIRHWATMSNGVHDVGQIDSARICADEFDKWQAALPKAVKAEALRR